MGSDVGPAFRCFGNSTCEGQSYWKGCRWLSSNHEFQLKVRMVLLQLRIIVLEILLASRKERYMAGKLSLIMRIQNRIFRPVSQLSDIVNVLTTAKITSERNKIYQITSESLSHTLCLQRVGEQ